jgi:hypothetical protein
MGFHGNSGLVLGCAFVIFKNNLNGFWEFLPWY